MKKESKTWLGIVLVLLVLFVGFYLYSFKEVLAPGAMTVSVKSDLDGIQPNASTDLVFTIQDKDGEIVKDFQVDREQLLHLIVVRNDLQDFQHLHPQLDETTGEFFVNMTFPEPGPYTLYADFVSKVDGHTMLSFDANVKGEFNPVEPVVNVTEVTTVGDLEVLPKFPETLQTGESVTYGFDVKKDGAAVEFEPYLGATGHSVILRAGDLDYVHVHAEDGELSFMTSFTKAGLYVAYTQFQVGGYLYTARTVFEVSQGTGGSSMHMTH